MAHLNYTISTVSTTESPGDSVNAGTLPSSASLIITPNSGYVVSASNFSISGGTAGSGMIFSHGDTNVVLPPEVANVTFSNTGSAGSIGNTVKAEVNFNHFLMPSADVTLSVDINGSAQLKTIDDIGVILRDNIDGVDHQPCADSSWPKGGNPISSTNLVPDATQCAINTAYFVDTTQGTSISASTSTITNWNHPININYPSQYSLTNTATSTKHTGSITPNTDHVVFTKTFWTPPTAVFEVTPFYTLNTEATGSGYYTVQETPTNYNIDKILQADVGDSNILYVDCTDIYPGMLITAENITSLSPGTGYPYLYQDIRVVSVDCTNGRVLLSEKVTLTDGDTINFNSVYDLTAGGAAWGQSYASNPQCLTKTFIVTTNQPITQTVDEHAIDFGMYATNKIQWLGDPQPKITNVDINTSDLETDGEVRNLTIYGNNADFQILVSRSDGLLYNFDTDVFGGEGLVTQGSATTSVPFTAQIFFPLTTADVTYEIIISPLFGDIIVPGKTSNSSAFASGVSDRYTINQYISKTLTFAATEPSGFTTAAGLEAPGNIAFRGAAEWPRPGRSVPTWSGTYVKDDGSILYDLGATNATTAAAGDFTNATANDGQMELTVLTTGSGTATVTITVTGGVLKQPTADTSVTLDIDNFITTTPRIIDVGDILSDENQGENKDNRGYVKNAALLAADPEVISVAPSASVAIDLRSYDEDGNKASKTLATVAGPTDAEGVTKGSLGAHSGGSVTYTANTNVTSRDIGRVVSFTYKATVGGVDSAAKTVYILIYK